MATYVSRFWNIDDTVQYRVEITVRGANNSSPVTLQMTDEPFKMEMDADANIYSPMKCSTATMNVLVQQYIGDIYNGEAQKVKVELFNNSTNELIWTGYVTPNMYTQPYDYIEDELAIECQDSLSTLQYYPYRTDRQQMRSIYYILDKCFRQCNAYTYLCVSDNLDFALTDLYISEKNFFDEPEKDETWDDVAWKMDEVVSEICTYLGLVCTAKGDTIYLLDPDSLSKQNIRRYTLGTTTYTTVAKTAISLTKEDLAESGCDLSLDNVYNKVRVVAETNETDMELADYEENWQSYDDRTITHADNPDEFFAYIEPQFTGDTSLSCDGMWNGVYHMYDERNEGGLETNYYVWFKPYHQDDNTQTFFYTLPTKQSGGTETTKPTIINFGDLKTYKGAVLYKVKSEEDTEKDGQLHTIVPSVKLDKYICLMTHAKDKDWNYYNLIKPNGSWSDCKVTWDGKYPKCPLFRYKDKINYVSNGKKKYVVVDFTAIYSNKDTKPYPIKLEDKNDTEHEANFIWCALRIGDKWVDGFGDYESTAFAYTGYDNSVINSNYRWSTRQPSDVSPLLTNSLYNSKIRMYFEDQKDYLSKDMKLQTNIDWRYGIQSSNGVCFELPDGVNEDDEIEFTIYAPHSLSKDNALDYVFIKDFKIGIEESNIEEFAGDDNQTDTVYELIIDENYVNELDDITMKVNTYDGKLTKSNVYQLSNGSYIPIDTVQNKALKDDTDLQIIEGYRGQRLRMEWWYCYKIWKQYRQPALVYETNIDYNIIVPYALYKWNTLFGNKSFYLNNYSMDYYYNKATVKLIEKK